MYQVQATTVEKFAIRNLIEFKHILNVSFNCENLFLEITKNILNVSFNYKFISKNREKMVIDINNKIKKLIDVNIARDCLK